MIPLAKILWMIWYDIYMKLWEINTEKLMNWTSAVLLNFFLDNWILNNQTIIVDSDNDKFTLTKDEKQNILSNFFPDLDLSEENLSISLLYQFCSIKNSWKSLPNKKVGNRLDNIEGDGLLYKTCQNGNDKIVQLLLKNGANANALNKNG